MNVQAVPYQKNSKLQTDTSENTLFTRIPEALFASLLLTSMSITASTVKNEGQLQPKKPPQEIAQTISENSKFYWKSLAFTPVGFIAGEGVWRSRTIPSDMSTNYSAIPLLNSPLAYVNELRFSARQTRFGTLMEGDINPSTKISAYITMDFLGTGTANSVSTNGYDLRIRHAYSDIDWNQTGWHLLAGQTWSLLTTNNKGITPRKEPIPPTIDSQYVLGFVYKRQAQFRLTKNLNKLLSAALSIESPETTFGPSSLCLPVPASYSPVGEAVVYALNCQAPGIGSLPSTTNYSYNHVPDVIAKLAYDHDLKGHLVHLEGFGIFRGFYDRVWFNSASGPKSNENSAGGGAGMGAYIEVIPKWLDFQGNVLVGRGIGSYVSGQLPDVTAAANGSLQPIPEVVFMIGTILHATPKINIYVYAGKEKQAASYFPVTHNLYFGEGVPNANNTGCFTEGGICAGAIQEMWQINTGIWNKFYQGDYGIFMGGLEYSYTKKILFPGNGPTGTGVPLPGYTDDNMVMVSLRYFPFGQLPA